MIVHSNGYLEEYIAKCRSGEIIVGQEMRQELENLAEDMSDPRYNYDTTAADLRIDFMQGCVRLTKSPYYNKPMILMLWQKAFISAVYGFKMADTGFDRFQKIILLIARKNTKALALDTKIPTPEGTKTIADIYEGDYVYGVDGKPAKVLGTSEIFKNRKCYKITFEDGEEIVCDECHKWTVQTKGSRRKSRYVPKSNRKVKRGHAVDDNGNITIKAFEMVHDFKHVRADGKGTEYKYRVPMSKAIEHADKDLPLDPYVLGLWLGDGDKNDNRLAVSKQDLETLISELEKRNVHIESIKEFGGKYEVRIGKKYAYHKHDIREALRCLGVWKNKHIPEEYLTASIPQRWELLRGLMDTDGTVSKAGQCSFTQKSKTIIDGFSRLLTSLGIKHTISLDNNIKCGDKICSAYSVQFWVDKTTSCFNYSRKRNRLKPHLSSRMQYKSIVDIYEVENRDTKCITVDRKDGLFLCGERNTVTHNSETCSALGLSELIVGNPGADIVCSSNDDNQASITYDAIDTMRTLIDPDNLDTKRNQRFIMNKANGSKIFKLSQRTRNKEGRNIDWAILDESHEMLDNVISKSIEQSQSLKDNPKFINITTEGFVVDGYLDDELRKARAVIWREDTGIAAERLLPWFYTQDSEQEVWQNPASWVKSNPTLGIIKKWDYLRQQIDLAQKSKADRIFVLAKDFNLKQNAVESWLNLEDYDYQAVYDLEDMRGAICLGAVDLSETTDLTCAKILMMKPNSPTKYIYTRYFIPASKLEDSDDRNEGAKYKEWAEQDFVTITEGNDIDLSVVADWFYSLYTKYNIRLWRCGYDQKFARDWITRMGFYGWQKTGGDESDLILIQQNAQTLSGAIRLCESDFKSQLINYGENPVDKWCYGNACLKVDALSQCLIVKAKPGRRIDGAVCLAILYEMYRRYKNDFKAIVEEATK